VRLRREEKTAVTLPNPLTAWFTVTLALRDVLKTKLTPNRVGVKRSLSLCRYCFNCTVGHLPACR
jgi:hypothetical protein